MAQEMSAPTLLREALKSVDIHRSQSIRRAHSNHGSLLFPLDHVKVNLEDESGKIMREADENALGAVIERRM